MAFILEKKKGPKMSILPFARLFFCPGFFCPIKKLEVLLTRLSMAGFCWIGLCWTIFFTPLAYGSSCLEAFQEILKTERALELERLGSPKSFERSLEKSPQLEGYFLYEPYGTLLSDSRARLSPSGDFLWSKVLRESGEEKLWLTIGDFENHGYEASTGTKTLLRFLERSFEKDSLTLHSSNAQESLNWIDKSFRDRFVPKEDTPDAVGTLAIGVLELNLKTGAGSYSGPMLPKAFLSRKNPQGLETEITPIEAGGMMVGGPEFANYGKFPEKAFTFKLQKGDRLFLMTDGITEAIHRESGEPMYEHLANFFSQNMPASEVAKELKHQMDDRAPESHDDRTMAVIEWRGD
jgi:hypothetical protein